MSSPATPLHKREWRPGFAVDIAGVVGVVRRGRGDPTFRTTEGGAIWRTSTTPDGAATTVVFRRSDGTVVMQAWGPGAYAMRIYLTGAADPFAAGRFTLVETPVAS